MTDTEESTKMTEDGEMNENVVADAVEPTKNTDAALSAPKKRKIEGLHANDMDDGEKRARLTKLLGLLSMDKLHHILIESAIQNDEIYDVIVREASEDPATRKLFVRGIPWESTEEAFTQHFEQYGEIEEATIIVDRVTKKSKGFGFVTFKTMEGANAALVEPKKEFGGRVIICNLAASGKESRNQHHQNPKQGSAGYGYLADHASSQTVATHDRKIFIRGLSWDTTTPTLLKVFGEFGPIEEGSVCTDRSTGKSKGFGFVTYVSAESARAALAQEAKVIDGRTTHCNLAIQGKNRKAGGMAGYGGQSATPMHGGVHPKSGAVPYHGMYGAAMPGFAPVGAFDAYGQQMYGMPPPSHPAGMYNAHIPPPSSQHQYYAPAASRSAHPGGNAAPYAAGPDPRYAHNARVDAGARSSHAPQSYASAAVGGKKSHGGQGGYRPYS